MSFMSPPPGSSVARRFAANATRPHHTAVQRKEAIERLHAILPDLRQRYGVRSLLLFGSTARDEAQPGSDVDLVVDLGPEPTYDALFEVHERLEAHLGCPVDVLTPGALLSRLKAHVDREGVRVA
jgi:predicted nucleotidyltransferase